MGRLVGKVAVITGGAGGLGSKHAEVFVREGAKVVIADLDNSQGRKLAENLGEMAIFIALDVTDEANWKNLVRETEDKFGPINVLVNNAGISGPKSIEEISLEEFKRTTEINQYGVFLGIKTVLPSMKKVDNGSIINISSGLGLVGFRENSAYVTSKFAVRGLTKAVAADVAKYGIRVNSVHPGVVKTAMMEEEQNIKLLEEIEKGIPFNRVAEPEEVANLVMFLASDESTYSTASEFIIDGGYTQIK
ncbi:glucose 1-dehydrogenase [Lysinibacillus capsici]|uniref:glucose 1-dehydrogenase n=1 Tax=Lysinibacillus capsici TaxID=2115968 RepID=UPI002DB9613E|nr:glucose 1-dehydrogenase [Lysinibacillus capsici]MEC1304893.1 SDR family oxidoreductase [Lysinibacillus capsici]